MSQEYYQSAFSGEQIDQGIGFIVSGEFEELAEGTMKAASDVQEAINNIPEGSIPIVDNLTTGGSNMALSAEQGKVLNELVDGHTQNKDNPHGVTAAQIGAPTVEEMNAAIAAIGGTEPGTHADTHAMDGSDPITPEMIGAVSNAGDIITGDLKIEKVGPYLYLNHTTTGRTGRLAETGDNYLSIYNEVTDDASNNKTALWIAPETVTVNNLLRINHVLSGASNTYSVIHTGNKNLIYTYGTSDLTAGTSTLETGKLYFVYE